MIIHNTVKCFQSCFPPPMMSTCVKWAKQEVEAFNLILARQLSSTERHGEVWTQCMDRVKEHAKLLSEVGLDFMNLVGRDVEETPSTVSEKIAEPAATTPTTPSVTVSA